MSVKIRLTRVGRKKAPSFKIIVANTRGKRYGKFLDVIGHYNPSHNPALFSMDEEKYNEWIAKGAQATEAVQKLKEGTYEYKHYDPRAEAEAEKAAAEAAKRAEAEKPAEEETTEASE